MQSNADADKKRIFIEQNIGDYFPTQAKPSNVVQSAEIKYDEEQKLPMAAADVLQLFARKKRENGGGDSHMTVPVNFDPRSLFKGTNNLVPTNSDADLSDG
jgi:hypothetical protein